MTGHERQLTSIVDDTRALIALLDAIVHAPSTTTINLHDFNGAILKTVRLWAVARDYKLEHHTLRHDGGLYDTFALRVPGGADVSVFDHRSRRVVEVGEETWRPGEQVAV